MAQTPQQVRIVSLIPSATEMLDAIGMARHMVGRSHECDAPEWIKDLPECTAPVFPTNGTSRDISCHVSERLKEALSIYDLHMETLEALAPTHIITQDRCAVCAVTLDQVRDATRAILDSQVDVIAFAPKHLGDVWDDMERLADAFGCKPDPAEHCRRKITDIIGRSVRSAPRSTVACLEWLDPLMTCGGWIPELVEAAGGREVLGKAGTNARWLDWDELVAADPCTLVLMPCGYDLQRTIAEAGDLARRESKWAQLRAVRNGRVFAVDGNRYFSRPGPGLVGSAEIMSEILYPDAFGLAHQGTGWVQLET